MSHQLYKTSNAWIVPPAAKRPVWLVEAGNPEVVLVRLLREFFLETDFAGMYDGNFGNVRVDVIHPFAMLLFQDIQGQKFNLDVFPSVTISDTVENEDFVTIGREFERIVLDAQSVEELIGHANNGQIIASTAALTRLRAAVATGELVADKGSYTGTHRIDFNIWGDNRDVVSDIYDMIKLCINTQRGYLHEQGISIVGNLDGRRAGDINVEFGMLLFGGNITVPCVVTGGAMKVSMDSYGIIATVDTQTQVYPDYHTDRTDS